MFCPSLEQIRISSERAATPMNPPGSSIVFSIDLTRRPLPERERQFVLLAPVSLHVVRLHDERSAVVLE